MTNLAECELDTIVGVQRANAQLSNALAVFQAVGASGGLLLSGGSEAWWGDVQRVVPASCWPQLIFDSFGPLSPNRRSELNSARLSVDNDSQGSQEALKDEQVMWAHEIFELRKKISFLFAELSHASQIDGGDEIVRHLRATFLAQHRESRNGETFVVVDLLVDALLVRGCVVAGALLRCLWSRVSPVLAATLAPSSTAIAFGCTVLGRLFHSRKPPLSPPDSEDSVDGSSPDAIAAKAIDNNTADGAVAVEAWRCIQVLVTSNGSIASECLRSYMIDFARCVCNLLGEVGPMHPPPVAAVSSCGFLNQWHALRLLTSLLGETKFGKLRTLLAESPALLCAVMKHMKSASSHLRFEAYHCLKVFIAKPNKSAPIRYLMWLNRDTLMQFINAHHQNIVHQLDGGSHPMMAAANSGCADVSEDAEARERERDTLTDRLINLQPLSREETLLLLKE